VQHGSSLNSQRCRHNGGKTEIPLEVLYKRHWLHTHIAYPPDDVSNLNSVAIFQLFYFRDLTPDPVPSTPVCLLSTGRLHPIFTDVAQLQSGESGALATLVHTAHILTMTAAARLSETPATTRLFLARGSLQFRATPPLAQCRQACLVAGRRTVQRANIVSAQTALAAGSKGWTPSDGATGRQRRLQTVSEAIRQHRASRRAART
jgi:hypothetical protein